MMFLAKAKATLGRRVLTQRSGDLPAVDGCTSPPPVQCAGSGCLPVEILHVILGFLVQPERYRVVVQRDLAVCARVCRNWTDSSIALLYNDVNIRSQRTVERLADSIDSNRSVAHAVRILNLPALSTSSVLASFASNAEITKMKIIELS